MRVPTNSRAGPKIVSDASRQDQKDHCSGPALPRLIKLSFGNQQRGKRDQNSHDEGYDDFVREHLRKRHCRKNTINGMALKGNV
jgi:hypothetical protein